MRRAKQARLPSFGVVSEGLLQTVGELLLQGFADALSESGADRVVASEQHAPCRPVIDTGIRTLGAVAEAFHIGIAQAFVHRYDDAVAAIGADDAGGAGGDAGVEVGIVEVALFDLLSHSGELPELHFAQPAQSPFEGLNDELVFDISGGIHRQGGGNSSKTGGLRLRLFTKEAAAAFEHLQNSLLSLRGEVSHQSGVVVPGRFVNMMPIGNRNEVLLQIINDPRKYGALRVAVNRDSADIITIPSEIGLREAACDQMFRLTETVRHG